MTLYKDTSATYEDRAKDLLSRMTLKEKIGQLCQSPMLEYEKNKSTYLNNVASGALGSRILADKIFIFNS